MEVSPPFVNGQRQYAILVDIHTQSLLFETKKKKSHFCIPRSVSSNLDKYKEANAQHAKSQHVNVNFLCRTPNKFCFQTENNNNWGNETNCVRLQMSNSKKKQALTRRTFYSLTGGFCNPQKRATKNVNLDSTTEFLNICSAWNPCPRINR